MDCKAKILFAVPVSEHIFEKLWSPEATKMAEQYGFVIDFIEKSFPKNKTEANELIRQYDAIITSWGTPTLDTEIMDGNRNLKIVGHAAGSVADLVSDALYDLGVKVVSANNMMARSVAEWCLSATLLGFSRMLEFSGICGTIPMCWEKQNMIRSVKDATIGIWGFGNIAQHYVNYLKPMEPKRIMVCSHSSSEDELLTHGLMAASLNDIFSSADVIVTLAGLNHDNVNRINGELLRKVKDGAVLINCGRARLIEESALITELGKKRFTAFLDVFHEEPPAPSNRLHRLPNVFMTPHVGGNANVKYFVPDVLENFYRFFRGQPLRNEIVRERAMAMTSHNIAFDK